jgi:colanic acid/amylovoran biosynthesis glycosyltransferase
MNTVVSEALATGLPVITTNHSGLPEQVLDGKNGMVVPEGDYEALATAIKSLIEHPELWGTLGNFGRLHIAEWYNSQRLIERQINYYATLASNAKSD